MSAFRRMVDRFLSTKASAAGQAIAYWTVGQPVHTRRDFENFSREAYVQNAIAHRCIAMIANCAASAPWMLSQGDDALDTHPALDLLARPNPMTPGRMLLEELYSYILIAGNAYMEGVGPTSARGLLTTAPRELYVLRPDRMRLVPGVDAIPTAYEYEANGWKKTFQVDPVRGRSAIMHVKTFDPLDDFYGMSSVDPAATAIDRHTEASRHNTALLQNAATPASAMIFKPVKQDDRHVTAPESLIVATEKRLKEQYAGSANAGKPMVLGGNVDWQTLGLTMEQLQLVESKLDAARDVCIAFGVPIELMLPGQSTYNNKSEAALAFYEDTVLPHVQRVLDHMNAWLLPMYGDGLFFEIDRDRIEALAPRRAHLQEQTIALYAGGIITLDEARETLQWDELDDDARAMLLAKPLAQAELQRAQAFQVDVNSGLFDDDVLREVRADQLAAHGTYPGAEKLKAEPEPVDPITFEDADDGGGDEPDGDEPDVGNADGSADDDEDEGE